jgi:hypothetical protein
MFFDNHEFFNRLTLTHPPSAFSILPLVVDLEAAMGVLMLTCLQTGREFSTGIHIDETSYKRLPDTVTKAACPHCGQVHSWWTREARLSETVQDQPSGIDLVTSDSPNPHP